jgi:hypothetical protein
MAKKHEKKFSQNEVLTSENTWKNIEKNSQNSSVRSSEKTFLHESNKNRHNCENQL